MLNTLFANRYYILKELGSGGFADVYLARDEKTNIKLALKIYNKLDSYGVDIFKQEYAKIAHLSHHGILTATYFDVEESRPYLVMPYCEGGALTKHLVDLDNHLSEVELAKIIAQIAEGLEYLHKNGIVHRDLKPDNVLYRTNDELVISDFGVSQRMNSTLSKSVKATAKQAMEGYTPAYSPPEREVIRRKSESSFDIFSFGVLLFELAAKDLPFNNTGKAVTLGEPIPELPGMYSKRINTLVKKCLEKTPEKRPTAKQIKSWA